MSFSAIISSAPNSTMPITLFVPLFPQRLPFSTKPSSISPLRPPLRIRKSTPSRLPVTSSLLVPTSLLDPKILRSSLSAISKLLATLLIGFIAAKRDLLPTQTLSALSTVVFNIFLPSLLFSNVVRTLSVSGSIGGLLYLPLAALLQIFFGLFVGFFGARLLRLRSSERKVFLVSCGFGNSAALPLLFAGALFEDSPQHLSSLVSAISFFLIAWTGMFWSLGYAILEGMRDPAAAAATNGTKRPVARSAAAPLWRTVLMRVLSPPLVAAILGLLVGLSPLCSAFSNSAMFAAIQTLGTGYSPAAVLILAGSLSRKVDVGENAMERLRTGRLALGISICRYLMLPLVGLLTIKMGRGMFRAPFVQLALLVEAVMPPAQNSTVILNLQGKPNAAASLARILLVVYLIGVFPVSVGLTYFLGLTGV